MASAASGIISPSQISICYAQISSSSSFSVTKTDAAILGSDMHFQICENTPPPPSLLLLSSSLLWMISSLNLENRLPFSFLLLCDEVVNSGARKSPLQRVNRSNPWENIFQGLGMVINAAQTTTELLLLSAVFSFLGSEIWIIL